MTGGDENIDPYEFKSDRCGIETHIAIVVLALLNMFKSDRCGIETSLRVLQMRGMFWFKSDRCGIETISLLPPTQREYPVQIRPLRD